jgi:hypothetical protein
MLIIFQQTFNSAGQFRIYGTFLTKQKEGATRQFKLHSRGWRICNFKMA